MMLYRDKKKNKTQRGSTMRKHCTDSAALASRANVVNIGNLFVGNMAGAKIVAKAVPATKKSRK